MKKSLKKPLVIVLVTIMILSTAIAVMFSISSTAASAQITNLYDYTKAEQYKTNVQHRYSESISVTQGDEIYVGPCNKVQGFHIEAFNSSGSSVKKVKGADMTPVHTFENGLAIYKWVVPAGVTSLNFANVTVVDKVYTVTKNQVLDEASFTSYWTSKGVDIAAYTNVAHKNPTDVSKIVNLFDPYTAKAGRYDDNGNFISDAYCTTDLIPVTEGDYLYFGPGSVKTVYHLMAFDSSKKAVGKGIGAMDLTSVDQIEDVNYIFGYKVPAGVSYVAVSCTSSLRYDFLVTKNQPFTNTQKTQFIGASNSYPKKENSPLKGMSIAFYGDSICYAGREESHSIYGSIRGWAGRIGYANEMTWKNFGVSGASISTCRGEKTIMAQVKAGMNSFDSDIIILHGGTNDAWDRAPLGTITEGYDNTSYDTSTVAGALEELISYIQSTNPDAIIGYIINFKFVNADANLNSMKSYVETIKDVCEKWEVPYVDLYSNDYITETMHPKDSSGNYLMTYFVNDYVHPGPEGYNLITPYIDDFVVKLVTGEDPNETPDGDGTQAPVGDGTQTPSGDNTQSPADDGTQAPAGDVTQAPTGEGTKAPENEGGCKSCFGTTSIAVVVLGSVCGAALLKKRKD